MTQPRPSKSDIMGWLEERRGRVYGQMHVEMIEDERYINATSADNNEAQSLFHERLEGFPKKYKFKVPPIARIGVQTATDQIMTGEIPEPTVWLPSALHRDDVKTKEDLELIRDWVKAYLRKMATTMTEDPQRTSVDRCVGLGLGVIYYPLDRERWPEHPLGKVDGKPRKPTNKEERDIVRRWERQRSQTTPWDDRVIHPAHAFPDPDHDPPQDLIIEEPVRNRAAGADEGARSPGQGGIMRVIYVSEDWIGTWIGNENFLTAEDGADADGVAPNPTGIAHFKLAWSGLGQIDDWGRLEYRGKGIIRDVRDLIDLKVAGINVLDQQRMLSTFGQHDFEAPEALGGKARAELEAADFVAGANQAWYHTTGVVHRIMESPQVPEYIFRMLEEVDRQLEFWLGPEALRGAFRQEAASKLRARIELGQSRYAQTKENVEQMWAAALLDKLYMIKYELMEAITLPGHHGGKDTFITLEPDNIPDGLMLSLEFAPPTQEERAMQLQEGLQLRQPGPDGRPSIPLRTLLTEYAHRDDADEIIEELWIESLLSSPIFQEIAAKLLAQQFQREFPGLQEEVATQKAGEGALPLPSQAEVGAMAANPTPGPAGMGERLNGGMPNAGSPQEAARYAEAAYAVPQF